MAKRIELVRVSLGYSARHKFAKELEQLPFGEGVLVLPNSLLTDEVKRKYNVETIGLDTLVSKLLNLNGYVNFDEISRRSQELIVQDIIEYMILGEEEKAKSRLHELDKDKQLSYFQSLAEKPGFVKAMASLVSQLARSGATREEIVQAFNNWITETDGEGRRHKELYGDRDAGVLNVYLLYRQLLAQNEWFDLEGRYRLALAVLEKEKPKLIWKKLYFSDYYSFDRLQLELIRAFSRFCAIKIGMVYEIGTEAKPLTPEREKYFEATKDAYQGLLTEFKTGSESVNVQVEEQVLTEADMQTEEYGYAPLAEDIRQLHRLGDKVAALPAENVQLYKFKSRESEMRWVLADVKRLLLSGVAAQEILVAVRDLNSYSGLRRLADEYGLPVSLPEVSALASQPLAELMQQLLESASDTHEGAEAYFALLTGGLGSLLLHVDTSVVDELRKKSYFKSREAAQQALHSCFPDDELWTLVDTCIAELSAWREKRSPLAFYTQKLSELLQALELEQRLGMACKQGGLPLTAVGTCLRSKEALLRLFLQLERDYERSGKQQDTITLADFRRLWQEALLQSELVLAHGRQDGVLLTSVINVPGLSFAHVYIMGLRDSEFPQAKTENWIYNDKERGELLAAGVRLPTTAQSYAEDACFFAQTLTAATKSLVLSWTEEAEHDESVYISVVQKLFTNLEVHKAPEQPCASAAEVCRTLADKEQAFTSLEKAEQSFKELQQNVWLTQSIGAAAAPYSDQEKQREQGAVALAAAKSDFERFYAAEGEFNGVLQDSTLKQRLQQKIGALFSPSSLELYAGCPFRYLGEAVWRQQQFVAKEDEVEPADEGSLLHEVMSRFMKPRLGRKLCDEEPDVLAAALAQCFAEVCADFVHNGRIVESVLWEAEKPRLLRLLQRWLAFEYADQQEWTGYVPTAVEWDFSSQNGKPLAMSLHDGKKIRLIGRIDRIDSNGESIFITDYKRSYAPAGSAVQVGLDLQLPIYLLAAAGLYKGGKKAAGGCYYVLKDGVRSSIQLFESVGNASIEAKHKSSRIEKLPWDSFKEFCESIVRDYIEKLYAGNFKVEPKQCDKYCQLSGICRLQELNIVLDEEGGNDDE